jgi:hypothetical protein
LLNDLGLLAVDCAEQQALVVGEDLISVQIVKGLGGILAGDLGEDDGSTGVGVDEFAEVVDFVIDDDPEILLGVVLWQCRRVRNAVISRRIGGRSCLPWRLLRA